VIKNGGDQDWRDRLQKFYIYLLKDDGTTINDQKYISHTVYDKETFYFAGGLARYVKIEMPFRSTVPYSYLQLAEVEVYEYGHTPLFVDQMVSLIDFPSNSTDSGYTCPYRLSEEYQCPGPKTFEEAVDYCAQLPFGRLCTDEEVYHGCVGPMSIVPLWNGLTAQMTHPLSCDSDLIWTSYSYDYGPVDTGCRATQLDPVQYSQLMQNCDDSMALLLGASTSVGSLVKIVDAITKYGTDRMPGRCCLDDATNSEFIGYNVRMNIPFL